jgi:hypothetical protein
VVAALRTAAFDRYAAKPAPPSPRAPSTQTDVRPVHVCVTSTVLKRRSAPRNTTSKCDVSGNAAACAAGLQPEHQRHARVAERAQGACGVVRGALWMKRTRRLGLRVADAVVGRHWWSDSWEGSSDAGASFRAHYSSAWGSLRVVTNPNQGSSRVRAAVRV